MQNSKQADANQLLSELAVHALLHHEFRRLSATQPFFTTQESNELLHKWLKPKLKSNRYRSIKKSLKSLLLQSKNHQVPIFDLLEKCVHAHEGVIQPHLDSYLLLINEIEKKLGTTVLLADPHNVDLSHDATGCLLCVLSSDLNQHFDHNNALITPISMLFRGPMSQRSLFLGSIYTNQSFEYRVLYQDEQFVRIELDLA